eukprot:1279818-Prymnesium_polylepis.2
MLQPSSFAPLPDSQRNGSEKTYFHRLLAQSSPTNSLQRITQQRDAAIELQVLPVAARPLEAREEARRVVRQRPDLVLSPTAVVVLADVVEVLEARMDHGAAIRLDPLKGAEHGEIVGDLEPQHLVALCCHGIYDNVAQMLPAVAPVCLVPATGGNAWDDTCLQR